MFKMKSSGIALLALSLLVSACTDSGKGANEPKARLQEYINKSFSVKSPSDKATLLTYLDGDAKSRLEAWSDDQFQDAFIDTKRQFDKLNFTNVKSVSPTEVQITYELSYLNLNLGKDGKPLETESKDKDGKVIMVKKAVTKVTNRKMAEMAQVNGVWLVRDVHNIKELVEFQDEMSLP